MPVAGRPGGFSGQTIWRPDLPQGSCGSQSGLNLAARYVQAVSNPLASTLTDNFDDNSRDTAKWNIGTLKAVGTGGTINETNQRLEILPATSSGYTGYISADPWNIDSVYVKITSAAALDATEEAYLGVGLDSSNYYLALIGNGFTFFQKNIAGSAANVRSVAYDSTNHVWFRLRVVAGTVYMDTAGSGASNPPIESDWTNFSSQASALDLSAAYVSTAAGVFAGAAPSTVYFDGLNTATAAATGAYSLTADVGTFSFTGQPANLLVGYDMAAAGATYSYTGQPAVLSYGRPMTAALGTFTYTGQAANLLVGLDFAAAGATFTYTGQDAVLSYGRPMAAAVGTFTYNGQPAGLLIGLDMVAAGATYSYNGQAAGLYIGLDLAATAGIFTYNGQDAILQTGKGLVADAGIFAYTGQAVGFAVVASLPAVYGTFTYTGQAANLIPVLHYTMAASYGVYSYAGQPARGSLGFDTFPTPVVLGSGVRVAAGLFG